MNQDVVAFTGFTYCSGEQVRLGDRVAVRRFLRRPLQPKVVQIYDPTRPSPPGGDNDIGFHIKIEDGSWGFCGSGDPRLTLISRGDAETPL
jgi:hypothetical protein